MKKTIEEQLSSMSEADIISFPDEERIWRQTQAKLQRSSRTKAVLFKKVFWIPLLALALVVGSVPVLGSVDVKGMMDWLLMRGDSGAAVAIEKGFGHVIDKSAEDQGMVFHVHDAVADNNRLILHYSIKMPIQRDVEYVDYNKFALIGSGKEEIDGYHFTEIDPDGQRILGWFETGQDVTKHEAFELQAEKVHLLEVTKLPINLKDLVPGHEINLGDEGLTKLHIRSVTVLDGTIVIDYEFHSSNPNVDFKPNFNIEGAGVDINRFAMVGNGQREEKFEIGNLDLADLKITFNYLKPVKQIDASWNIPFAMNYDEVMAETKVIPLNIEAYSGGDPRTLTEMIISPSQIKIVHRDGPITVKEEAISYRYASLQIGDTLVRGRYNGTTFVEHEGVRVREGAYSFPYSIKDDLDLENMKLIYSYETKSHTMGHADRINRTNAFILDDASEEIKSKQVMLGDIPLKIEYQLTDGDLIFTVTSLDENFGKPPFGMPTQWLLLEGSKQRFNNELVSGFGSSRVVFNRVEGGNLAIYPVNHKIEDPEKTLEIDLQIELDE